MTVSIGFGRVGSKFFPLVVGWVGLGQSADGLGWVTKMDPWITLGESSKWISLNFIDTVYPNFLITQCGIGQRKPRAKNQLHT